MRLPPKSVYEVFFGITVGTKNTNPLKKYFVALGYFVMKVLLPLSQHNRCPQHQGWFQIRRRWKIHVNELLGTSGVKMLVTMLKTSWRSDLNVVFICGFDSLTALDEIH